MKAEDLVLPLPKDYCLDDVQGGIRVRDHIAIGVASGHVANLITDPKKVAKYAYEVADALIEESQIKQTNQ